MQHSHGLSHKHNRQIKFDSRHVKEKKIKVGKGEKNRYTE